MNLYFFLFESDYFLSFSTLLLVLKKLSFFIVFYYKYLKIAIFCDIIDDDFICNKDYFLFRRKLMKHSFTKKIISLVPIFAASLSLSFHSSEANYKQVSPAISIVKYANSTDEFTRCSFDGNLGVLSGLTPNIVYHLVPQNCPEPINQNAFEFTSNANGEISLLDDIGENPDETDTSFKSVYAAKIVSIYQSSEAEMYNFDTLMTFPTKEECIKNIVGDGSTTGGYGELATARQNNINELKSYSGEKLTVEQEGYYETAKSALANINSNYNDYKPSVVVSDVKTIVETYATKAHFITYKIQSRTEIENSNSGYNDALISQYIADAVTTLDKDYTVNNNSTTEDIDKFVRQFNEKVAIRKVIVTHLNNLEVKIAKDVDSRSKPLTLKKKADEVKDEYYEKINNATTIAEADALYDEFCAKIDDLILATSWGHFCYAHWLYIIVLTFYAAYFLIRGLIARYRKLDVFNIIAVSIFGVITIGFSLFISCDLCTIMIISGWSLLVVTLAVFAIYTLIGFNEPVYKTVTDEDIERRINKKNKKDKKNKHNKHKKDDNVLADEKTDDNTESSDNSNTSSEGLVTSN